MMIIALAIKLDGKGPVLFRQRRHGWNHEIIEVLKFRTMTEQEDGAEVPQATRNDKRVTKVGRFLRRTSLDELPQLFNVLKGDMSLVGPRPHALSHNDHYSKILEDYACRHRVKPGITGWAQINGFRGETAEPEMMMRRVKYDLEYIENWSIPFDLEILFMTPLYGFISKHAY
jgi:putative colanic acid biosynthesis UDP-glucose lipid carrier transferase